MARPINIVPTYRLHKPSGRAVFTVRNLDGTRKEIHLSGAHGSPASKEDFDRVLALLRANGGRYPAKTRLADLTVSELVLRFMHGLPPEVMARAASGRHVPGDGVWAGRKGDYGRGGQVHQPVAPARRELCMVPGVASTGPGEAPASCGPDG